MNINRNNYEEYFLLYADMELSADEKGIVEMFVQQNPDLEEEFIMLQQSVIKPDNTIILEDKSSLLRKEEFINQNNYEEKFLLYTDNELNFSEKEETEKFVLSNPSLQTEFTLLQHVKYGPDTTIVFPDKRLLCKKEHGGKVIFFRRKALAAAVVLGIGLWTGIIYLQNYRKEPVIVGTQKTKPKNIPVMQIEQKREDISVVTSENGQKPPLPNTEPKTLDNSVIKQQQITVSNLSADNKPEVNKISQKKENVAITDMSNKTELNKPSNNLPQPDNIREPANKTVSTTPVFETNNYAMPASYITDEEVKSDNYVFYNITAEEFKKSKVGNFLKKVKRTVERKLPFKGNGLRIGNVEIAKDTQN